MKYTAGLLLAVVGLLGLGRAADATSQGRPSHVPMPFEHVGAGRESSYPFLSRGERYGLALSAGEFRMVLDNGPKGRTPTTVVLLNLEGASSKARLVPGERLRSTSSYFLGGKPDESLRKVPHYATLKAATVYPGVDLVLSRGGHALEYELVVAPGGKPSAIRLGFKGIQKLRMDENGDLTLGLDGGDLVHRAPDCYQWIGKKKVAIEARYRRLSDRTFGLAIDRWDRSLALFIRPVVDYVAFIGAGGNESGKAIDVDAQGSAYVTGTTLAFGTVLPTTPGAVQPGPAGGTTDAFVVKLTPDGSSLAYATFLGGTSTDYGNGIAVGADGAAYVTGETYSTDFPFTPGAFQTANAGRFDAFVTKLNADGTALVYSSYLGGNGSGLGDDAGRGIAVNSGGEAYVTGSTGSGDFPMAGQPVQSMKKSFGDAFVTKFRADGAALVYSTFLGGDGSDVGYAIALDRAGNAYVAGETSGAFPTTPQAFQPVAPGGSMEGFVAKVSANGSTLVYSTYVGGPGVDRALALDVTDGGRAYVAGVAPAGFPTTPGALQTTNAGSNDAFVAALSESGSTLVFATYLGGSQVDRANGIGVDRAGDAYVTGETYSSDFPTAHGALSRCQGGGFTTGCNDAFVVKLDNSGSRLLYSSFLGGPMSDYGSDIVATPGGDAYVTGRTSSDIPTTPSGYRLEQAPFGLFVVKLSNRASSTCDVALSQPTYANGESVSVTSAKVKNDRLEDFAFEVKVYHRAPDGSIASVLNRGGDGTFLVTAQSEEQLGPLAVLTVSATTPRGRHAIGCRIREPGTGELLAEAAQTFEVP